MPFNTLDPDLQQNVMMAVQAGAPQDEAIQRAEMIQSQRASQPQAQEQPSLLRTLATPFERAGRSTSGALFEMARAGANPEIYSQDQSKVQKVLNPANKLMAMAGKLLGADLRYTDEQGQNVENPFLTEKALQTIQANPTKEALKTTAGLASFAVPFGRGASLASKALLPGAVAGGLFESSTPNATPESVMKAGLVGGVTAGALNVGGQALSKLRGGTKNLSTNLRGNVVKPQVEPSPTAFLKEQDLINKAQGLGLKGSAQAQRAQSAQVYNALKTELDDALIGSSQTFKSSDLINRIAKRVQDEGIELATPTQKRLFNRILKKAIGERPELTASEFGKVNFDFQNMAGNLFSKASPTESDIIKKIAWEESNKMLKGGVKEVAPILEQMSALHQLAPGLQKSAQKANLKIPFIGEVHALGGMQQRIADTTGRGLKGISNLLPEAPKPGIMNNLASVVAPQLLGQAGTNQMTPTTPMTSTAPETPTIDTLSPEVRKQLYDARIQAGSEAKFKQMLELHRLQTGEDLEAILYPDKDKAGKLTEFDKKFAFAAQEASKALRILESGAVKTGKIAAVQSKGEEFFGTQDPATTQFKSQSAIARTAVMNALLGANMAPQEVQRIADYIFDYSQEPAIIHERLKNFVQSMDDYKTNIAGGTGVTVATE